MGPFSIGDFKVGCIDCRTQSTGCHMIDACRPYRQLARNALLANQRLHGACAALQLGEWGAARASAGGGSGSIGAR